MATSAAPSPPLAATRATRSTVLIVSAHGTLWMLDAANGSILWRYVTGGRVGRVVYAEDTVYVPVVAHQVVLASQERLRAMGLLPPEREMRPVPRVGASQSWLLALDAESGTVRWEQSGWSSAPHGDVFLDDGVLITDVLGADIGERVVSGHDASTGASRWTPDLGRPGGLTQRLLTARNGYVFVYTDNGERGPGRSHTVDLLDAHTGRVLRQRAAGNYLTALSPDGRYEVSPADHPPESRQPVPLMRLSDGTTAGTIPPGTGMLGIDGSVAYVTASYLTPYQSPGLSTWHITNGAEIWHTAIEPYRPDLTQGRTMDLLSGRLAVAEQTLYLGRVDRHLHAEAIALDKPTGRILWRWHSPGNYLTLLPIWGRETPRIVLRAVRQFLRLFGESVSRCSPWPVWQEIRYGAWRHPGALLTTTGMTLSADDQHVYVGTPLGIFALDARTGKRAWHLLPTVTIARVYPSSASGRAESAEA